MLTQLRTALLLLIVLTVVTGIAYPLVMTGMAQVIFPHQANGSLIERDGRVIGSALLGQSFTDPERADPETGQGPTLAGYVRGRPSAAVTGPDGVTLVSGGSNYGPTNQALIDRVAADVAIIREENNLGVDALIPVDLVTASASGLDPHISPAAADLQVARVAAQRGLTEDAVRELVAEHTEGRFLGFFGEPRVHVLNLNLALDEVAPVDAAADNPE